MNAPAAEEIFFKGNQHLADGNVAAALACFRQTILVDPACAEAYANLGLLLESGGEPHEAEICYRRSIALDSKCHQSQLNYAAFLAKQKRFEAAESGYLLAIELDPAAPATWSNLGVLYACMKREQEAESCYRLAIELDASYGNARFNLSYLLLRQGRFEEGWRHLEARNWSAALAARMNCPRWQGETLAGKSLLIAHEGGHGDMIQFCRYATVLKAQGAGRITLICPPELLPLFAMLDAVDALIPSDQPIPNTGWDYWTPLFSLPYHCATRIDSIPAAVPYLQAPSERIEKWARLLPQGGFRIGVAWKGNPRFENDQDRSLPGLDLLVPLGAVKDALFISLQKGAGEDQAQRPPVGFPLIVPESPIEDFADSAAIVSCLDLVISVDTAVAHLAGALGIPCWVLLPDFKTDWRWLTERTDTPWYPGMRLFRQAEMGKWQSVIAEVLVALEQAVLKRPETRPVSEAARSSKN